MCNGVFALKFYFINDNQRTVTILAIAVSRLRVRIQLYKISRLLPIDYTRKQTAIYVYIIISILIYNSESTVYREPLAEVPSEDSINLKQYTIKYSPVITYDWCHCSQSKSLDIEVKVVVKLNTSMYTQTESIISLYRLLNITPVTSRSIISVTYIYTLKWSCVWSTWCWFKLLFCKCW